VKCALGERIGVVRARVEDSAYGFALVVSAGGVLLGRLRKATLEGDPEAIAEDVMEAGPSTVRRDEELGTLVARLREGDLNYALVSTPDGELVGVLRRSDAEARLEAP
jgi:predicted transcriptional regulator